MSAGQWAIVGVVAAIVLFIVLMAATSGSVPDEAHTFTPENADPDLFEIVRVRGCEYVVYHDSYKGGLAHAGDCDNPIHKATP